MLRPFTRLVRTLVFAGVMGSAGTVYAQAVAAQAVCTDKFDVVCDQSFTPAGASKLMHYYASLPLDANSGGQGKPTTAFIAIHGFKHTVAKTFEAGLQATRQAGKLDDVLVIAPIFHADESDPEYARCMNKESPKGDQKNDLLWTCQGWMEGAMASNEGTFNSFDALDALIAELKKQWPSIQNVTVAGFSAGGQVVQRYIGYANERGDVQIRYVISDPGSWFYFDAERPVLQQNGKPAQWQDCTDTKMEGCSFTMEKPVAGCDGYNQWKYGIENMPTHFKRTPAQAREYYAKANIFYMQGEGDTGEGPGTVYNLLDKSCAAQLQGPYRLQRGLAFAAYDQAMIAPEKKRTVTVVPECKHDVICVFSSELVRPILFGQAK